MLVLTRKTGSVVYGGRRMGANIESNYDHKFTTVKIVDNMRDRFAIIAVEDRDGAVDSFRLDAANDEFYVDDVRVALVGIRQISGADDALVARIGIDAPRDYQIVRDDANKKFV